MWKRQSILNPRGWVMRHGHHAWPWLCSCCLLSCRPVDVTVASHTWHTVILLVASHVDSLLVFCHPSCSTSFFKNQRNYCSLDAVEYAHIVLIQCMQPPLCHFVFTCVLMLKHLDQVHQLIFFIVVSKHDREAERHSTGIVVWLVVVRRQAGLMLGLNIELVYRSFLVLGVYSLHLLS